MTSKDLNCPISRRRFMAGMASITASLGAACRGIASTSISPESGALHIISLSFDDGFRKSFIRIAEIYEKHSLSGCFNVIASAHMPGNEVDDEYMKQELFGDFELWNQLQDRGHEIMPHGYRHADLAELPLEEAKRLILDSLEVFSQELRGFDAKKSVFNFPYNRSSAELEEWLPSVVMAFRTSGGAINPLPGPNTIRITTGGFGPGNSEQHLDESIAELLAQPAGWLVYNLHGLNEEGWGPIRPQYLDDLLAKLTTIKSARILPVARALLQAKR